MNSSSRANPVSEGLVAPTSGSEPSGAPGLPHYVTWRLGCDGVGTQLLSALDVSYAQLVAIFGKPNGGPFEKGDKLDACWNLTFTTFGQFDRPATIYNYKDGKNYEGRNGLPVSKIRDWHIGGELDIGTDVVGYIASMLLNAPAAEGSEPGRVA